jgi:serine/threonine protein kinase
MNGHTQVFFCKQISGQKRDAAVKRIDKKTSSVEEIDDFRRECALHKTCHHTNVVELLDKFEDNDHIWLVMERADSDLTAILDK